MIEIQTIKEFQKVADSLYLNKNISDGIIQLKHDLTNMVGYQQEYKDSSDKYEKMVFIRNACSPGNGMGIQSEYIKRYMNDIIIDCNKMLGYMFGGVIQLDVPVINEKQFSIPFLNSKGNAKQVLYGEITISSSNPLFNPSHGIPNALY